MANQQDVSVGWKKETTYGTPVTVDRWAEILNPPFDYVPEVVQGEGLRVGAGGVARSSRRVVPTSQGSGEVELELFTKGLGTLFELAMGEGSSTLVSGTAYQQLFTLVDGLMPSATIQVGLPDATGTVQPYTYGGCTCQSFELNVPQSGIATFKTAWHARSLATGTALATPSYPSGGSLLHWGLASVTYGGTVTGPTSTTLASGGTEILNVRDFSLSVAHNLAGDRFNMGASGLPAQPIPGRREITGTVTVEYSDNVLRDAYLNQTGAPMVLTLAASGEALSTGVATVQVVLSDVYVDGSLPKANGGELITTQFAFTALDDETASEPLWIAVRTSDTAL